MHSLLLGLAAATLALQIPDGHGRPFDLASLRGRVVAVTSVSRYTKDEAARVHAALAARSDVTVVSVVDFVGIPSFVHGYARRKVAEADGAVLHLCDEHGDWGRSVGAHPDQHVDIFIVDRDGALRGRFEGAHELGRALHLLDELRASSASSRR